MLKTVTLDDVAVFRALRLKESFTRPVQSLADIAQVCFTEAQGNMLATVTKRNTILFDQLQLLMGGCYTLAHQPMDDLLSECVIGDLGASLSQGMSLILEKADGTFHSILSDKSTIVASDSDGEVSLTIPTVNDALTHLLYTGFTIGRNTFRPFIASASMSRLGQYFFINQDRRADVMRRTSLGLLGENRDHALTMTGLDMGLLSGKVVPSKISAYMGLVLSDGLSVKEMQARYARRVGTPLPDVTLDATNTLCLADLNTSAGFDLLGPFCWAAKRVENENGKLKYSMARLVPSADIAPAKLYDGCGFFSDELMDEMEKLMRCTKQLDTPRRYDSLVIRLPWMKGLAVRMRFLDFIRERINEKVRDYAAAHQDKIPAMTASGFYRLDPDEKGTPVCSLSEEGLCALRIKDAYGILRPLFVMRDGQARPAVRALFTQSMFKGFGHFQVDHCTFHPENAESGDGWAEYWQRIKDYDVSLLIATQNSKPGDTASLNYQLLASSGLSDGEMAQLLKLTVSTAASLISLDSAALPGDTPDDPDGDDRPGDTPDDDPDSIQDDASPETAPAAGNPPPDTDAQTPDGLCLQAFNLKEAYSKNPAVLDLPFVQEELRTLARAQLLQASRGRLLVQGDYRFIVPDLIAMLDSIVNRMVYLPKKKGAVGANQTIASPLTDRAEGGISHGRYYAPGITEERVVLYRNPHICSGENVLLTRLPEQVSAPYEKWCAHLTGCVFCPTAAIACLSGADSDGDRGLICTAPLLADTALRCAKNEADLLAAVIRNKQQLLALVDSQSLDPACLAAVKELIGQLPDDPRALDDGCHTTGINFEPVSEGSGKIDLAELDLENALFNTWNITRRQRVGRMSLFALDISRHIYSHYAQQEIRNVTDALKSGEANDDTRLKLLPLYVGLWRMLDISLTVAGEIDSAKSGKPPRICPLNLFSAELSDTPAVADPDHPVVTSPLQTALFGKALKQHSSFRLYRTKLNVAREEVIRLARQKKISKVVASAGQQCPDVTDDKYELSLCTLPQQVSKKWQQLPEPAHRTAHRSDDVPARYLLDDALLRDLPGGEADEAGFQADLDAAKTLVTVYVRQARRRSALRKRRQRLRYRFYHINRCLLRRYPLDVALTREKSLLGDGSPAACPLYALTDTAGLRRLLTTLSEQQPLLAFTWSSPAGRRQFMKDSLALDLAQCKNHDLLEELLCDDMDGVYLLKHVLHYLLDAQDAALDNPKITLPCAGKTLSVKNVRTPAALMEQFRKLAEGRFAACGKDACLRDAWVKQYAHRLAVHAIGGSGNDFLLFSALGNDYTTYIRREEVNT